MNDKAGNNISGKNDPKQTGINIRSKARGFLELTSFIFLFISIALIFFSMSNSPAEDRTIDINFSFTMPTEMFIIVGVIYIIFTLVCLFLLFSTTHYIQLNNWIERPNQKADKWFGRVVWPFIWIALVITFFASLIDISEYLTDGWRFIVLIVGILLLVLLLIRMYTYNNLKSKPPQ